MDGGLLLWSNRSVIRDIVTMSRVAVLEYLGNAGIAGAGAISRNSGLETWGGRVPLRRETDSQIHTPK